MITGRFSVWDLLVLTPPATAVVQLLLPFAFGVRPAQLAQRAGTFAMLWVVFICAALCLPRLAESAREELGYDGFLMTDSWIFTAGFAVVMTGTIASVAVSAVRGCRRDVRMRPVAQAELRALRPLVEVAGPEMAGAVEWAVTAVERRCVKPPPTRPPGARRPAPATVLRPQGPSTAATSTTARRVRAVAATGRRSSRRWMPSVPGGPLRATAAGGNRARPRASASAGQRKKVRHRCHTAALSSTCSR